MPGPSIRSSAFCIAALCLLLPSAPAARWAPPIPAELTETVPLIEPDAGAEVLASEITLDDSAIEGATTEYYLRIKIFTDQAVSRLSKIELPYDDRIGRISRIEARTIRPDGSVAELSPKEVFDRVVVRSDRQRIRVKSFAPPALAPGVIVEYRYQTWRDRGAAFFPLHFQGEFPIRSATVRFRPVAVPMEGLSLQAIFLNCPDQSMKQRDPEGYYTFRMNNLRARQTEPFQPPAMHVLASVILYYALDSKTKDPEAYWGSVSRQLHQRTAAKTKVTKPIAALAVELTAGESAPLVKLQRLHDYCRAKLVNRQRDGSGLTAEQRRKFPTSDDAADTLKNKGGTSDDINYLFVALAKAAGFDARLAAGNDRSAFIYLHALPTPFTFTKFMAAVKVGDEWHYYDPGSGYLAADAVNWRYADTSIAIASEKGALIQPLVSAPSAQSHLSQVARLSVDENGTLEGDVTMTCTGYFEFAEKNALDAVTPDAAEKYLKAKLDDNLKSLEVSAVRVENANKPLEPLKVTLRIKVPGYAERTGSRLFVQPSIFRRGARTPFEAETRRTIIIFPYRFTESDEVTLTLPKGYAIEAGSAPLNLQMGAAGDYQVKISWNATQGILDYRRNYRQELRNVPAEKYPALKEIFEILAERDNHTLTFKQVEEPPQASAGPPQSPIAGEN